RPYSGRTYPPSKRTRPRNEAPALWRRSAAPQAFLFASTDCASVSPARVRLFRGLFQSGYARLNLLDLDGILRMAENAVGGPQARRCRHVVIEHDLQHRGGCCAGPLLQPRESLPERCALRLPVGGIEVRLLQPAMKRSQGDVRSPRGLLDAARRQQGQNRRLLPRPEIFACCCPFMPPNAVPPRLRRQLELSGFLHNFLTTKHNPLACVSGQAARSGAIGAGARPSNISAEYEKRYPPISVAYCFRVTTDLP